MNAEPQQLLVINKRNLIEIIQSVACPPPKEILSVQEMQDEFGITRHSLYKLTSNQKIPYYKKGRLYFKRSEIIAWIEEGRVEPLDKLISEL